MCLKIVNRWTIKFGVLRQTHIFEEFVQFSGWNSLTALCLLGEWHAANLQLPSYHPHHEFLSGGNIRVDQFWRVVRQAQGQSVATSKHASVTQCNLVTNSSALAWKSARTSTQGDRRLWIKTLIQFWFMLKIVRSYDWSLKKNTKGFESSTFACGFAWKYVAKKNEQFHHHVPNEICHDWGSNSHVPFSDTPKQIIRCSIISWQIPINWLPIGSKLIPDHVLNPYMRMSQNRGSLHMDMHPLKYGCWFGVATSPSDLNYAWGSKPVYQLKL